METDLAGINELASVGWAILKVAMLIFATIFTGLAIIVCIENLITRIKRVFGG